jgi:hypothetical protein
VNGWRASQLSFLNESEISLDTFQFYVGATASGAPVHYHGEGFLHQEMLLLLSAKTSKHVALSVVQGMQSIC